MALSRPALTFALAASCLACTRAPAQQPPLTDGLRLTPIVRGLDDPVHLAAPAGDPRLFIVEKGGRIRVWKDGRLLTRPFLNIAAQVSRGSEQGLLSVAFHPRYAENGRFVVNYTDARGDTRVVRYRADPAADTADPASATVLLAVDQPFANHNGGHVLFGPDGRLYVGMGDGGSAGDPRGNAQDPRSLLGKLLRIDADFDPTAVPRYPPVEVWALGLRNPWRIAFDSGWIYIADVGQNRWEEINVAPAARRGLNYGWRTMEGRHCYRNPFCSRDGLVAPAAEYSHDDGCSVIGGTVYRGRAVPALSSHYFYSDWCSGWLRSFRWADGAAVDRRQWRVESVGQVTSFGTDGAGEVYVIAGSGTIYRIEAAR